MAPTFLVNPCIPPSSTLLHRAMMRYPHPSGKGKGGCDWDSLPVLAGGVVDWAHIPQERGGAPGRVVGEGVELARAKVVME